MGRIVVTEFVSLDGVMEDPGGSENFKYGGWTFEISRGDEGEKFKLDEAFEADALLLGRVTYEGFADAWLSRAGDPFADLFNAMPKYVATRTVTEWKWNAQPLEGDAAEAVRRLKESEGGDLIKYGTGSFSKTLLENKLVDEYHFWFFPVVAEGDTMFRGTGIDITHLELLGTTTFKSGIVVHKLGPKA